MISDTKKMFLDIVTKQCFFFLAAFFSCNQIFVLPQEKNACIKKDFVFLLYQQFLLHQKTFR